MPAPSTSPLFATDATYAADGDPWSGDATKEDPGSTRRAEGFEPDLLPAPWLNFVLGLFGDWIEWLRSWTNPTSVEFVYPSTKTRKRVITAAEMPLISTEGSGGSYQEQWFPSLSGGTPILIPVVNAATVFVPIDIPSGCTISDVEVLVRSSAARSTPNGWTVKVYEESIPWSSPAAPTSTQQGSTTEGGLSSGYSKITVGSLTPFIRVNEYTAHALITGPTGSLGANDQLLGIRVTFTDGGPRHA